MSDVDVIVVGRRVLTTEGLVPASVHVRGGIITHVGDRDDVPPGAPTIDAGESVVMPGLVDTHVHVNEPGRTEWEGFETATRAAAAGGVTTIVDMPLNSIPATTNVFALLRKAEALHGRGVVDVGLWGGAVPGNEADLLPLLEEGALGFKCFLVDSGVDEFPPLGEAHLARTMERLAPTLAPLLVHAELPGPIEAAARAFAPPADARSYAAYLRSRPPSAEDEAVALLARLVRTTRARAHVVHLSSSSSLDLLRAARDEGLPLSAETAPHYLSFEAETIADGATAFKCAPPVRERANREGLWAGLADGILGMVVTDHSPCVPALKRLEVGRFDDAWGGIASLQFGLSAVWTEAHARGFGLESVVRWMAEAPADLAGLGERKGRIRRGRDADLVFFDPDATYEVRPELVHHRHALTPYEGRTLRGVVRTTLLRGEVVYDGRAFAPRPRGIWLKRQRAT